MGVAVDDEQVDEQDGDDERDERDPRPGADGEPVDDALGGAGGRSGGQVRRRVGGALGVGRAMVVGMTT